MNLYLLHFRKKNQENPPEKFCGNARKFVKMRNPQKNPVDIQRLALEHAMAYFNKPWDSYLKSEISESSTDNDYRTRASERNRECNSNCVSCSQLENNSNLIFKKEYSVHSKNNKGFSWFSRRNKDVILRNNNQGLRCQRREPRYEYTALADESFLHDRLEMDRKLQRDSDRNMSTIRCQYYLRGSNRYVFLKHLPDMGSRLDKHWFLVRDSTTKTERLLTMTPMAEICPIKYTSETRQILLDLFLALQHPYIYPVLDIDRKIVMEQEYVIAVVPFNDEGSLKDLINQSQCQDDWKDKYHYPGYGLASSQIQRLGCQILEALLFLKDQRFPPFLHLHSGNIIVQNGVARICGLENTLFGYSSRTHLFIPKRLHDNKEAVEVICFGHLLFEMATGYELTACHPSEKNYLDVENKPLVIDVLKFIFEQGRYRYPSLQQIASLDFFRHIDLRELRSLMPVPSIKAKLSPAARSLLRDVKRHQRSRRQSKRSQSMHTLETESVDGRESRSSGYSNRSSKKKKKRSLSSETTPEGGTQLQTLPLTSIEGSFSAAPSAFLAHPSYSGAPSQSTSRAPSDPGFLVHPLSVSRADSGSLDYFTPPTTPQLVQRSEENPQVRAQLLREIERGARLKRTRRDPLV